MTCYSCPGPWRRGYPQIRFAAGADPAEKLRALVDEAKCGVHADDEGLLWVFAPSIIEMMHFADLVPASALAKVPRRSFAVSASRMVP